MDLSPSYAHPVFREFPRLLFFAPFFAENEERADHPAGPRLFGVKANEVRRNGQSPTQAAACGRPRLDNLERGGAGRAATSANKPVRKRRLRRTPPTYSLCQLFANACIAASTVASWPRVGVRPSWKLSAKSPRPIRRRHIGEHNPSYNTAFTDHVVGLVKSYSRPLEPEGRSLPQSSSASRLTADASGQMLSSLPRACRSRRRSRPRPLAIE